MHISALLPKEHIASLERVSSKEELLNRLVDLVSMDLEQEKKEKIRNSVFTRELVMSTGVGKGIAIPHGKCDSIDFNRASFIRLKEPVEYQSIDKKPVHFALLLVGPLGSDGAHIKLLSRVSRLLNSRSFREKLTQCTCSEEICMTLRDEEKSHFTPIN